MRSTLRFGDLSGELAICLSVLLLESLNRSIRVGYLAIEFLGHCRQFKRMTAKKSGYLGQFDGLGEFLLVFSDSLLEGRLLQELILDLAELQLQRV